LISWSLSRVVGAPAAVGVTDGAVEIAMTRYGEDDEG
jgi:hypothetical protein